MSQTSQQLPLDDLGELVIQWARGEHGVHVVLSGEADLSTLEGLERGLAEVDLEHATGLRLDLTRLDFADVASIRRLVDFARQARRRGFQVRTCGARPTLGKVVALLDVHDDLGLA